MSSQALSVTYAEHPQGCVAHIVIHGQKTLNLVDDDVLNEARETFEAMLNTPDLRCVLFSGRDERAFIGGANLNTLRALGPESGEPFIRSIHDFCLAIREAPVPVVAVLRGYCLGAGLEIAAACDFRIGTDSVRCGMPEVRVGVPSVVEAALLPGLIGWGKARELMLRGNIIDAAESLRIGVLQHCVPDAELDALAQTIAADLMSAGPVAIAAQKRLFLAWEELPVSAAIEAGVESFVEAYKGDEPQIKISEFFDSKR